jgi:two-component system, NarL family, invasion response regulator UvrY
MTQDQKHQVVLVDDHTLFRKGIAELVNNFENYSVIWEASNGKEFLNNLKMYPVPEIVILDIAMPVMDGFETAYFLKTKYPDIKILVLSMLDSENSIIKMLKIGVHGYILKDATPSEFKTALDEIMEKGSYYSEIVVETMANNIATDKRKHPIPVSISLQLTNREKQFLELVCTELTYKEIAEKMFITESTADHYRNDLFNKLKVKSRVGLVIYAIKNKYFKA